MIYRTTQRWVTDAGETLVLILEATEEEAHAVRHLLGREVTLSEAPNPVATATTLEELAEYVGDAEAAGPMVAPGGDL